MRHVGNYSLGDSYNHHYVRFNTTLYALNPEGRYVMMIEHIEQDRVVSSAIIDLSDAMGKSVSKPEFQQTEGRPGQTEPKQETSAKGLLLPGVSRDDTVIVDREGDFTFRLFNPDTLSYRAMEKQSVGPDGSHQTCKCNAAMILLGQCGCRGVRYSNVGMAVSPNATPTMTPPIEAEFIRRMRESGLITSGPVGAAVGTSAGTAISPSGPSSEESASSIRDYVRRRAASSPTPRPRRDILRRSSSDADIEEELRQDGMSEEDIARARESSELDPNQPPF